MKISLPHSIYFSVQSIIINRMTQCYKLVEDQKFKNTKATTDFLKQIKSMVSEGELITFPFYSEKKYECWKEVLKNEDDALSNEIDGIVSEMIDIITQCKPLELLKIVYHQMFIASTTSSQSDGRMIPKNVCLSLLLLYIQNVIISYKQKILQVECITEEKWKRLQELHEAMQEKIMLYHICREVKEENNSSFEKRKLMFLARVQYNAIAGGKQHQYLILELLSKLLTPHDKILQVLFEITSQELIEAIKLLRNSLIEGMGVAGHNLIALHQEFIKSGKTVVEFIQSQQDLNTSNIFRQVGEYDLYDLQKVTNLPVRLLNELSASPGEDGLFSNEPNAGWPTKLFPSLFKPFIKIDDRYYCFHIWNLTDNIYRALQEIIIRLDSGYKNTWNIKQSKATEDYVFELFEKLLPEAEFYRNVNYYLEETKYEADGLACSGDHLLIVEIKAGKHSQRSPTTNFEYVYKKTEELIGAGYHQGRRLFKCLDQHKSGVKFYDKKSKLLKEVKPSDYKHITVCCITLEQIVGTEGNLNSLKAIESERNIDLAEINILLLSIDDLVTYSKLFQDSLTFCDFLEKRNKASKMDNLLVFEELCHYGAYRKHDDYAAHFAELIKETNSLNIIFRR